KIENLIKLLIMGQGFSFFIYVCFRLLIKPIMLFFYTFVRLSGGGTPSRAKKEYWEGDIAWYSSGELNDLYTKDPERHINELAVNNSNAKLFPKGSLLIGMYDTAALKMSIIDREATFNQAIAGVKPNDKIDLKFILYSINSIKSELLNLRRGVRQKNLSLEKIKKIPIPLPPLSEQKRIVSILDKAFAAIDKAKANAEQNLKNSKELFENYLQTTFENGKLKIENGEWEEKRLGDICNIIGGGTPSKKKDEFYNGDILWATVRDMKSDTIKDTEHKITKDAVKNSSTNIIPKNNVIIATRVGLGKVCLLQDDTAINQDLKGIIPKNKKTLEVDFLFRWFKGNSKKIIDEGTGATVQGVKLPFIKSLVVYLPPLKEQQAIVKKLNALSAETKKLEAIYQQKIEDLEELKKSILQKAFNGELKVEN
ncbi:restriction endonuclease subunit S, partial [Candidatus Halobeggiatoa sp. HSG11]|nr:restriction endonuclease subunit S [Candidatus Halobeggiatoa sp. HSG11]